MSCFNIYIHRLLIEDHCTSGLSFLYKDNYFHTCYMFFLFFFRWSSCVRLGLAYTAWQLNVETLSVLPSCLSQMDAHTGQLIIPAQQLAPSHDSVTSHTISIICVCIAFLYLESPLTSSASLYYKGRGTNAYDYGFCEYSSTLTDRVKTRLSSTCAVFPCGSHTSPGAQAGVPVILPTDIIQVLQHKIFCGTFFIQHPCI